MSSMWAQRVHLQCGLTVPALPTGAERAMPPGTSGTLPTYRSRAQCLRVHLAPHQSVSHKLLVLMLFWPAKGLGRRDGKKVEGEECALRNVNSLRGEQRGSSMVRDHLSVILGLREECRCLGRMRERIFRLGGGRTSWTRDTMNLWTISLRVLSVHQPVLLQRV